MKQISVRRRFSILASLSVAALALQAGSCRNGGGGTGELPAPRTKKYSSAIRAFYIGAAALEAGDVKRAQDQLTEASEIAPGEPAIWADLALLAMRSNQFDAAAKHLEKARAGAPNDSRIIYLAGVIASHQGKFDDAAKEFQRAVDLDGKNLQARYALFDLALRQGGPESDAHAKKIIEDLLQVAPDNLVANLELARLAAKAGDSGAFKAVLQRLAPEEAHWQPTAREQFTAMQAAAAGDVRPATTRAVILQNVLKADPKYGHDAKALRAQAADYADPILRLIKLPSPSPTPAPADFTLKFTPAPVEGRMAKVGSIDAVQIPTDTEHILLAGNNQVVWLDQKPSSLRAPAVSGYDARSLGPHGLCCADLNSDYRTDLILAGPKGLVIQQLGADGAFTDFTAQAKLPASIAKAPLTGVWACDIDMDGDLDLVVSTAAGQLVALQNNADGRKKPAPEDQNAHDIGTFKLVEPFKGVRAVVDFQWADIDLDGDPDAIMLDATGKLHVFTNERAGRFTERAIPGELGSVAAFTIIDGNDDGVLDIAALKNDGSLVLLSDKDQGKTWTVSQISRWDNPPSLNSKSTRLFAADLDNNGGIDLIASTAEASQAWLHDGIAVFKPLVTTLPGGLTGAADVRSSGRLDLIGLGQDGKPITLQNTGDPKKAYAWQEIRPHSQRIPRSDQPKEGDQRINSFGIGGEIEIRAGLLVQKQPIESPVVHFGLGENEQVEIARILWPNGMMQAEFGLKANERFGAQQRLKGSCPWIFAWNGKRMEFVTDFLWRSPLGLKINAQDTGAVAMTQDWVKIRGDQLVPHDGFYDLRITAELWETHFFDQVSLMTVDHPAGTEIFVDERFAIPPPKFGPYVTGPLHSFAQAVDDRRADVSATVRDLDGKYLDTFGLGYYQGVTRDHYVELALGDDAPVSGPLWLVAQGWIHPTDSSLNVAMSQGSHPAPRGLSLEVADGKGGWTVARPSLGFPSGKNKSILIDLKGVFRPGAPRRLRLRTNLEVYWDRLAWAAGIPGAQLRTNKLLPQTAELRYRGYSVFHPGPFSSPEIPNYDELEATRQKWLDLLGYCTRFGDVKELIEKVDDRYVIMNAGDEMALRFPAQTPPAAGWVRDYVLIGDGWEKDGDFNTGFSKTVLPLPSHNNPLYNKPPGRLEDDPVYRRYPRDWETYHTRYVSPDRFWTALRVKDGQ